jgi:RND superfamily putative drug exporter
MIEINIPAPECIFYLLGLGIGFVTLLANVLDMPSFAPQVTLMIGIGVGIDYALFIVTRYREALHAGSSPEQGTKGSAGLILSV